MLSHAACYLEIRSLETSLYPGTELHERQGRQGKPGDLQEQIAEVQKPKFRGWRAAPFAFAVEAFQSMVYATLALNLYTYAFKNLHLSPTDSSKVLNDFSGTATLLTLVAGSISDTYISQFTGIIIGEVLGTIGSVLLTVSAAVPSLHPPPCQLLDPACKQPTKQQNVFFFSGLYLLAIGIANLKPNAPSLGAAQFDESDPTQKKQLISYFNWFFFCTCLGALPAVTVISYAQEQANVAWGFGIPAILLATSILVICIGTPYRVKERRKSPLTGVLQVFVAASRNWSRKVPPAAHLHETSDSESGKPEQHLPHTDQFSFLDKAAIKPESAEVEQSSSPWKLCTMTQVEEVKTVLRILPIFASTIIVSCILSQLQTFTLLQGYSLDKNLSKSFEMPLASLAAFPLLAIVLFLPLYDRVLVPALRKHTGRDRGFTHLQRLGLGLAFCTLSMVVAALVETKRLALVRQQGQLDNPAAALPMSVCWLVFQFLVFGIGEMFTMAGLFDFFYTESPENMQTMGLSLVYVSISFGYFLSSAIVSLVNRCTNPDWLPANMNRGKLNSFYWMLSVLGTINFFIFLVLAWWYKPKQQYESNELQTYEKSHACLLAVV